MAERGWYVTSAEESPKTETLERKSASVPRSGKLSEKHKKTRTLAILFCVLVLIVSTSYAFSLGNKDTGSGKEETPQGAMSNPDRPSGGGQIIWPEEPGENKIPALPGFEDFEDFFDSYNFGESDDEAPSSMPRAEIGVGPEFGLTSASGEKEQSWQEVYKSAIESVVSITAIPESDNGYFWGSGTVLSEDGYILTNAHMIAGTKSATVTTYTGDEFEAKLVGRDNQSDLAVLKIEAKGLKPAVLGVSDELSVGDEIAAIGNPISPELIGTMTNGIVSAINRDVYVNGRIMTLLQTNAALNEGNSGGPVVNHFGQVVGIVNMKMASRYSEVPIEGIGFAIPSSGAIEVVNRIIKGQPGIGVTVRAMTDDEKESNDLPAGLYVNNVEPNSDAYTKGIREGDIIIRANGIEITETEELLEIRNTMNIGDKITFTLYREGKTFEAEVELMNMNDLY